MIERLFLEAWRLKSRCVQFRELHHHLSREVARHGGNVRYSIEQGSIEDWDSCSGVPGVRHVQDAQMDHEFFEISIR